MLPFREYALDIHDLLQAAQGILAEKYSCGSAATCGLSKMLPRSIGIERVLLLHSHIGYNAFNAISFT
jgi:hypothetical protein